MDSVDATIAFANLSVADIDDDSPVEQVEGVNLHQSSEPEVKEGEQKAERPFGPQLRAGNRRNTPTTGEKWIAPEATADRKLWNAPGKEEVTAETKINGDLGCAKGMNSQDSRNHAASSSAKKDSQEANDKQSMDPIKPSQPPTNGDSASANATNKGKEIVLSDKELGHFGSFNMCLATVPGKSKRPRVRDEVWSGPQGYFGGGDCKPAHGMLKPILFLGKAQQILEQWVLQVAYRNHKPMFLLVLPVSHPNATTPGTKDASSTRSEPQTAAVLLPRKPESGLLGHHSTSKCSLFSAKAFSEASPWLPKSQPI
nr:uncharacterized protein LOC109189671 [Ipomoea batatas]